MLIFRLEHFEIRGKWLHELTLSKRIAYTFDIIGSSKIDLYDETVCSSLPGLGSIIISTIFRLGYIFYVKSILNEISQFDQSFF